MKLESFSHAADGLVFKGYPADGSRGASAPGVLVAHEGVGHSFTNPDIDAHGFEGFAYDADAEQRSWRTMLELFDETLGPVTQT